MVEAWNHTLSSKLKDVSEIYYFSDGDASQDREEKISSTSAIIHMILVLILIGTSLHHMAKVYNTRLWKQKTARHVCKTLISRSPETATNMSSLIFEYCTVHSKEIIVLEERFMTVNFLPFILTIWSEGKGTLYKIIFMLCIQNIKNH